MMSFNSDLQLLSNDGGPDVEIAMKVSHDDLDEHITMKYQIKHLTEFDDQI